MKLSKYAKVFKALSNEQRLKLFLMIYRNCCGARSEEGYERAFTKACDCMNLSRSTISHHFKELQSAGLITCERAGQAYRCRVNEEALAFVKDLLK